MRMSKHPGLAQIRGTSVTRALYYDLVYGYVVHIQKHILCKKAMHTHVSTVYSIQFLIRGEHIHWHMLPFDPYADRRWIKFNHASWFTMFMCLSNCNLLAPFQQRYLFFCLCFSPVVILEILGLQHNTLLPFNPQAEWKSIDDSFFKWFEWSGWFWQP